MVRASMYRVYILVLLISFLKKNIYISRLNFTPKIEIEKFGKIRPFEKSKNGTLLLVHTPFPQLQKKFHRGKWKNEGADEFWLTKTYVLRYGPSNI